MLGVSLLTKASKLSAVRYQSRINALLIGGTFSGPGCSGPEQQKTENCLMLPPPPRPGRGLACDVIIRHYTSPVLCVMRIFLI